MLLSQRLYAQTNPCNTNLLFEVVKIAPSPGSASTPAISTVDAPSMRHVYYLVRLKTADGQPLPSSISYTYMSFNGIVGVSNPFSAIDVDLTYQFTNQLHGTQNPQIAAALSVSEDGEVDWTFGDAYDNCQGAEETFTLPINGIPSNQINLFVIVVRGGPDETLCWKLDPKAEVQDCDIFPPCAGTIPVNAIGDLCHTFQYPLVCAGSAYLSVELNTPIPGFPASSFDIYLNLPAPNYYMREIDGRITIQTDMIDPEFLEFIFGADPVFLNETVVALGGPVGPSFDIYLNIKKDYLITGTKIRLLQVTVARYNCSVGGSIEVGPSYCRMTHGTVPDAVLCNVICLPEILQIPGYDVCGGNLSIVGNQVVSNTANCDWKYRFELTHTDGSGLNTANTRLEMWFITAPGNDLIGLTTDLPCSSCLTYTTEIVAFGNKLFKVTYANSNSYMLNSGAFIDVEFANKNICVEWWIVCAETERNGDMCAMTPVRDAPFPTCRPLMRASVKFPKNNDPAPANRVALVDVNTSVVLDEKSGDCVDWVGFCQEDLTKPYLARVRTATPNDYCGCGVTTFDIVLINKYILNQEPLDWWGIIAGNVSMAMPNSPEGLTPFDAQRIRRCILGLATDYSPNSAPAWIYIHDEFVPGSNPLAQQYLGQNTATISPTKSPRFWAIKSGDVNGSCQCYFDKPAGDQPNPVANYRVAYREAVKQGSKLEVPVYYAGEFPAIALQGAFKTSGLLLEVRPNESAGIDHEAFGLTEMLEGYFRFAWVPTPEAEYIVPGTPLFYLTFDLRDEAHLPELWSANSLLDLLAYDAVGEEYPMGVVSDGRQTQSLHVAVSPNPFADELIMTVSTLSAGEAQVWLTRADGMPAGRRKAMLQTGEQTLSWRMDNLPEGVYYLHVAQQGAVATQMVVKH